jgi:hypothetical protein
MTLTRAQRLSQRDFAALDTISITRGIKIGEAQLIAHPTSPAFRETAGD